MLIGGVIGGIYNVASNWDKIDNFWDGFVYFNIGGLAGFSSAFLSNLGSFGLSFTKFGGAVGGAMIGGPTGFVSESMQSFLNSLYEGNSLGKAYKEGGEDGLRGLAWGTALGGLGWGIDAALQDRNFWTGAEMKDEILSQGQNLPGIGQRGKNNCVFAIGENVDNSLGGNLTQENLRSLPGLGGNPENDPISDVLFWDTYTSSIKGRKYFGETYSRSSVFDRVYNAMSQKNVRVAVTLNGSVGHEVAMSSIVNRTFTYINGSKSSKLLYYVFDPSNGGSIRRISKYAIKHAANIFYIYK